MQCRLLAASAALAVLLPACSAQEPPAPPSQPFTLGVWSEFLSADEAAEQVPFLRDNHLRLYQSLMPDEVGTPAYEHLFREAAAQGVEARAWLLLPHDDGYWANEQNVDQFAAHARAVMDWVEAEELPMRWLVLDMEMAFDKAQQLEALRSDLDALLAFMRSNIDPVAYDAARAKYQALVDEAHGRGFQVMCVTWPNVLDEPTPDSTRIQDAFDTPVRGIGWDEVSLMVYRSMMVDMYGPGFTPYLIYSYGQDAVREWGARSAIDVGLVAAYPGDDAALAPGVETGFSDPAEVLADIGAARAAGIPAVQIFALDYVRGYPQPARWVDLTDLPADIPEPDTKTAFVRSLIQSLSLEE